MKTEDFDDAIRRKLESLQNEHTKQDVDAVHQYVRSQKVIGSKRRRAFIFLFVAASFLFSGLLTWNIVQSNELSNLKKNIAQLKKNYLKAGTSKHQNARDTVFIIRYSNEDNGRLTSSYKSESIPAEAILQKKTTKPESLQHDKIESLTKNEENTPSSDQNILHAEETGIHERSVNAMSITNKSTELNLTTGKINTAISEPASIDSNLINKTEQSISSNASNGTTETLTTSDSTLIVKEAIRLTQSHDSAWTNANLDKPVFIKNWNYRIGIGMEAGKQQLGISLLGEAVFKHHWALSAGIRLLKNGEETFDDDDDYDDHKKKDFKKAYENQVDNDDHKNIQIRNTIFQIPLNISYLFPLKHNFVLQAGLGTDLDVYIKQHVQYRHSINTSDLQTKQFITHYPPVYFNNCVITLGLQKTIQRFVFQLSPYLSPQLKRVDYKTENLYYGLRLRTYFEF